MRTRNELERLTAAGRPLVANAESLVDTGEEDRILERILASERPAPRGARRGRAVLALAGAAVLVAAAAVAAIERGNSAASPPNGRTRHHPVALSGATFRLSSYRFKTPAGFKASSDSCVAASSSSGPVAVMNGFAAAASADGGCVEAFFTLESTDGSSPASNGAQPVDVGTYPGYFVPADASGESTLYVQLPTFYNGEKQYVALFSEGLTEEQLIAVAQSGLPGNG
jgi:hypothetical protein